MATTKNTAGGLARANVQHLEGSCEHRLRGHGNVRHHTHQPVQPLEQLPTTISVDTVARDGQSSHHKEHRRGAGSGQCPASRGVLRAPTKWPCTGPPPCPATRPAAGPAWHDKFREARGGGRAAGPSERPQPGGGSGPTAGAPRDAPAALGRGHAQVRDHVQRPVQLLEHLGMTNFVKAAAAEEQ
jgi:hypothetical protein